MSDTFSATSLENPPFRRQPVQERSVQRVERMLDASAELLDDIGYEALTTTLIAQRAGVAIGSLYQFFPGKRAVVQALVQRNHDRFVAAVAQQLQGQSSDHWWDAVELLLDIYIRMYRHVPGFSTVPFRDAVSLPSRRHEDADGYVMSDSLCRALSRQMNGTPGETPLPISIAIEAADGLFRFAFHLDPGGEPRVIAEAKSLIKNYLVEKFDG